MLNWIFGTTATTTTTQSPNEPINEPIKDNKRKADLPRYYVNKRPRLTGSDDSVIDAIKNAITKKEDWWIKIRDQNIYSKWISESIAQVRFNSDLFIPHLKNRNPFFVSDHDR